MAHQHGSGKINNKIKTGLLLNTCFAGIELLAGIMAGSLALVSDAGHNFTDSLTLFLTYMAERFGKRQADKRHSFGHERITILAALFNASVLVLLAAYIIITAIRRIMDPEPVSGSLVIIVSLLGIIINGSIAFIFSKEKDLHMRSAFIGMAFDTAASIGALVAGLVIYLTQNTLADPLISILIALMLLFSTWEILHDSLHILLEGTPKGMDVASVEGCIRESAHVKEVDDLHIWSLSSHDFALSCHIVLDECDLPQCTHIVKAIKAKLQREHNIGHATIEVELYGCSSSE